MMIANLPLLAFYQGLGTDHQGRRIEQLWALDRQALEYLHDYIQWLFPTTEKSRYSADAPLLSECDIDAFHRDEALRHQVLRSLDLMLDFYGFERGEDDDDKPVIRPVRDFHAHARHWITAGNHNFLRITRILTSLRLLGQEDIAAALWRALAEISRNYRHIIGGETIAYWRRAARADG